MLCFVLVFGYEVQGDEVFGAVCKLNMLGKG